MYAQLKAKLTCESATEPGTSQSQEVVLRAIYTGSPEDNTYAAATPNAMAMMTINNPEAFNFFEPGKKYNVTFTPAEF